MTVKYLPVAQKMLEDERERLLADHFEDRMPGSTECEGCARAAEVKAELALIEQIHRKAMFARK